MRNHRNLFSYLVHYDRFTAVIKLAFPAVVCMLKSLEGKVTEYIFIDATPMAVCHNLPEKRHKVFKGLAKKGKTSTGWFFGFKLHFILNTFGEIVSRVYLNKGTRGTMGNFWSRGMVSFCSNFIPSIYQ